MVKRVRNLFWLASRDYHNEWQMSGFFVLALAAVLGPMMILFGLKFGIVGSMVNNLIEDPRNQEIHPAGSGRYDMEWIEKLRERPEIAFIIPRTRSIAATMELKSEQSGRILPVELIPTDRNDPLLPGQVLPEGLYQLVLSESAAHKLKVNKGDTVNGSLSRRFQGRSERVYLDLQVVDVAPAGSFDREGAFVSLSLVEAVEDFRDGRAVPALAWHGTPADDEARTYPSFRLYTRSIYDVAPVSQALEKLGIEVRTHAADIEIVRNMDRNLTAVFWVIAAGFFLFPGSQPVGQRGSQTQGAERAASGGIPYRRHHLVSGDPILLHRRPGLDDGIGDLSRGLLHHQSDVQSATEAG